VRTSGSSGRSVVSMARKSSSATSLPLSLMSRSCDGTGRSARIAGSRNVTAQCQLIDRARAISRQRFSSQSYRHKTHRVSRCWPRFQLPCGPAHSRATGLSPRSSGVTRAPQRWRLPSKPEAFQAWGSTRVSSRTWENCRRFCGHVLGKFSVTDQYPWMSGAVTRATRKGTVPGREWVGFGGPFRSRFGFASSSNAGMTTTTIERAYSTLLSYLLPLKHTNDGPPPGGLYTAQPRLVRRGSATRTK
jgi:hypothetical protein